MEASVSPGDGGRRRRLSFAPTAARAVFCAGLVLGSLVVHNGGLPAVSLISLSPPVIYTPAAQLQDFSITIPSTWRRGTKLGVKVPTGNILVDVPKGMKAGQTFVLDLKQAPKLAVGARQQKLVQKLPKARKALQTSFKGDLTSFQGMLEYERGLRSAMGKLKHKWPSGLKVPKNVMLAHNFINEKEAPDAEGWDPENPNGFAAGPSDVNNTNGVPGYTYTMNGEDVGVEDKGPGYYQPEDPEHWTEYQKLLRFDCFQAEGQPWRDHANCAALVKRSHTYPNADMFKLSGAYSWNPPFSEGGNATNKPGAIAPDPQEYWNYGTDDDFKDAARWDGTAFAPAEGEEEEEAGEEAPEEKAPVISLAAKRSPLLIRAAKVSLLSRRAADFGYAAQPLAAARDFKAHKQGAKKALAPEALAELVGGERDDDGDGMEGDEEMATL